MERHTDPEIAAFLAARDLESLTASDWQTVLYCLIVEEFARVQGLTHQILPTWLDAAPKVCTTLCLRLGTTRSDKLSEAAFLFQEESTAVKARISEAVTALIILASQGGDDPQKRAITEGARHMQHLLMLTA